MVAIKKCVTGRNLGMAHRVLRELRLLRELAHDNVVTLYGVYCSGSKQSDLGQMYAIMELVDGDLSYVLSSKSQSLTQAHVTYMAYQLLCGLKYIHSAGVMHRDISPGNLLVNKTCELKICDFGLARLTSECAGSLSEEQDTKMSMYVCTRWYRAPELLCFLPRYGTEVDIWSAGCVIMELHTRRPLLPGDSTMHQIELIINVLGFPEGCAAKVDNARIRAFLEQKRSTEGNSSSNRFKQLLQAVVSRQIMQASAADLIERMLCLEQEKRSTAAELLENGFVAEYHDSNEEPVRSPIDPSLFNFERQELDKASVQTEFLREMAAYHSSIVIEGEASG
jgi:mitogen-activated protein kinase 1/3